MSENLLSGYSKNMFSIMTKLFPDTDEKLLKEKMKEIIMENFLTKSVIIEGNISLENNNKLFSKKSAGINAIDRFISDNNPTMSSSGVFFKRHDEEKNILGDMCDEFMKKRKMYKKEMFKHINDEDKTVYNNFDSLQKNMKILNNSFFGASAEPNSIFYNPLFGPSITGLGQDIIMTAMNAFETFLSNNIEFRDVTEVIIFCKNVMDENYKKEKKDLLFKKDISYNDIIKYFESMTLDKSDFDILKKFLQNIDKTYFIKFYYKNNFREFINDNCNVAELFLKILDRKDFLDPNNPPEDMKEIMEEIWYIISDWVFYNYQNFNRTDNALNHKRKSVTGVDTDSNFVYLKPYLDFFVENYDGIDINDNNHIISIINLITYQLTHVINETCNMFTKSLNVPEEFRPRLNFKNEFCLKRIMFTPNKKNYASIMLMQEGNVFNNPKLDIKGLPIRKVSVNKNIRNFYTELLEKDILKSEKIDISKVISEYKRLENIVRESLKKGEINYVIPGKVNAIESYKEPYQIMSLRGTVAWNILFPNKEITFPNKINMIKLIIKEYEDHINRINELYMRGIINEKEMENYKFGIQKIFSNEKMVKNGFNVIALPQNLKRIPKFLIDLIDVDTMTNDNIQSGIIMLKSLGFKTLDILTKQYPTNIISI